MSVHREIELKVRLADVDSYRRLVGSPRIGSPEGLRRHWDTHFDTEDLRLARSRAILRLRADGSRGAVLTFKQGGEREGHPGLFDATEIEEELDEAAAASATADPAILLDAPHVPCEEIVRRFGRLPLRSVARYRLERCVHRGAYRAEIDRVILPSGEEFHEVEVETDDPDGASRWLQEVFRELGVVAKPSRRTKLEEALSRMRRGGPATG